MNLLIPTSRLDRTIDRGRWFIIIGFPTFLVVTSTHHGPLITAMAATALGAEDGCFSRWRTESGLWMLAILYLLMFLPIYAALSIAEIFGSHAELTRWDVLDFAAATFLFGKICRLLISAGIHNWQLTRSRQAPVKQIQTA